MTSADVPHSLALPELDIDIPALKGSFAERTIEPKKSGNLVAVCGDPYCGIDHAKMVGKLIVED